MLQLTRGRKQGGNDWCSWTDGHSVVRGKNTQDMAPGEGPDQHRQRCKTDRGLDRREEVRSDNAECGVCFCRWLSKAVAEDLPLQTDRHAFHSFIYYCTLFYCPYLMPPSRRKTQEHLERVITIPVSKARTEEGRYNSH